MSLFSGEITKVSNQRTHRGKGEGVWKANPGEMLFWEADALWIQQVEV